MMNLFHKLHCGLQYDLKFTPELNKALLSLDSITTALHDHPRTL